MESLTKIYCIDCRDLKGNLVKEFPNIEADLETIRLIIDSFAFEYASVIARSNECDRLYGKRRGCQIRRMKPEGSDLPFAVIKYTKTLKEAVDFLKVCDNGFYDVITERGVLHCYQRSGFNLWEI